ncbi:atrial natriuretic peptide receptor 1-like [Paramacrobiotus metropolitanus]|uniref:atrial natriuretic peptide receptor 1-like n=1 Tax=Paramacrobiotus metropolitanus TaxID=2943436 RepID=UPI0024458E1E|nr:atrial natriuretic peptide receptor 1-like [Paramacrobiotus metropolitanus]
MNKPAELFAVMIVGVLCRDLLASRLNVITLTSANATGSGTEQMLPTFAVALDDMQRRYPLVYANYTKVDLYWGSQEPICRPEGDGLVPTRMAEWYRQDRFTGDGITVILSAELDVAILACGTGVYTNQTRSPHVISLAQTSYIIFGQAVGLIMDIFSWRYIVIISDKLSKTNGNGRNTIMCDGALTDLQTQRQDLQHIILPVDSDAVGFSYRSVLGKAADYSHVILCCTMYSSVRRLLATAYDMNMTNGDFVFMYLYEGEVPFEPPPARWQQNDSFDQKVLEGLASLIVIRTPETNWATFLSRADQILRLRERLFAAPYDVELLFSLTYENASIAGNGLKTPAVHVQQFDAVPSRFANIFYYNPVTKKYDPGAPVQWKRGVAPVDRVTCGVNGAACQAGIALPTLAIVLVGLLIVFIITTVVVSLWYQQRKQTSRRTWWIINETDFKSTDMEPVRPMRPMRKLKKALCLSQPVISVSYFSADTRPGCSRKFRQIVRLQETLAFRKQLYWRSSNKTPHCTSTFLTYMAQMHKMESANVNKLLGIHLFYDTSSSFYTLCQRGSIEDCWHGAEPDWMLKLSLIQDIIRGMIFIHGSAIKKHGNLKSTKCLLDSHMAVKITDYGHEEMSTLLSDSILPLHERPFFAFHCWMAPEVMRGLASTQESDVYAFGLILHQIIMHCRVFGTGPHCTLGPFEIIDQVQLGEMPYFRPVFLDFEYSRYGWLVALVKRCWDEAPANRPTMRDTAATFKKATVAEEMEGTLMDRVIRWLTKYNAVLEQDVASRTALLLQEHRKADDLLRQMLPSDAVKRLRAGLTVEAEYVDAVSILFSDIFGFNQFVAGTRPQEVMAFLHEVYTGFDQASSELSIYKMETIGSVYMAVSGLVERIGDSHANEICLLAQLLLSAFNRANQHNNMEIRIGAHSGPVAVGVVGFKRPRYCLFGDTVNTAARIETSGMPSRVHVSGTIQVLAVQFGHHFEQRGEIQIKGKGKITTFWLLLNKS